MQKDRVAAFEDLRVGDAGVGHVGVDAGLARPGGTGTGAAGNGLVVAETGVAEGEIVHAWGRKKERGREKEKQTHKTAVKRRDEHRKGVQAQ